MNELFDLSGKVAIITGGTGVLGGAMSKGLAQAGAKVAILGRNKDAAAEKAKDIKAKGGEATTLIADVLVKTDLLTARDNIMEEWGRIDILVNAAGGNLAGATIHPDESFLDLDDEALEEVMDLNFLGTYYPTKIFAEFMIENMQGSIINISSMATDRAITRVLGYSASKAAVENFTKFLAIELALKYGDKLRVNAIAPGFFVGDQNRELLLKKDGSLTSRGQAIVENTPMKRFGKKEELIGIVIWLASKASKFVTGTVVPVDGGFSAYSGV